jgi:hypothetical protein
MTANNVINVLNAHHAASCNLDIESTPVIVRGAS